MKIYRTDEKLVRAVVKYLNLDFGTAKADARWKVYARMEKLARTDAALQRFLNKTRDKYLRFTLHLGQTVQVRVETQP
jgi:hypothetical protein